MELIFEHQQRKHIRWQLPLSFGRYYAEWPDSASSRPERVVRVLSTPHRQNYTGDGGISPARHRRPIQRWAEERAEKRRNIPIVEAAKGRRRIRSIRISKTRKPDGVWFILQGGARAGAAS